MGPQVPTIPPAILVVEDQYAMRRLIVRMLEQSYPVMDAGTAQQGLTLLKSHPEVELAIVDMVMPGMSGLDLAAHLSREHPGIKILYISGYVASIAIQAIADQSPDAVLLKPFTEQTLVERVHHLLGHDGEQAADRKPPTMALGIAWECLIEGSDEVLHAYRIASYRDTPVAYSIAAAHAAVLRQAGLPYQFQQDRNAEHPFDLLVPAEQWQQARDAISMLGLSADIAVAA
jgi:CheY-like chemotaxis protein